MATGFEIISEEPLSALQLRAVLFRTPLGLRHNEAEALARQVAPEALIDTNTLYSRSGSRCAKGCRGAELVRLVPMGAGACLSGAPVAMIDTGVDIGHPALRRAAISARSFVRGGSGRPAGHGTAIAALLVGEPIRGTAPLAPGARPLAAEVFEDRTSTFVSSTFAHLQSLYWSVTNGARVIMMSLEGPPNAVLRQAITRSAERANLVAAAGNQGRAASPPIRRPIPR